MNPKLSKIHASFIGIISLVAWYAVIMQFSISIPEYMAKGRTFGGSVVQLLSYFTILSNILVASSLASILLIPKTAAGQFFAKAGRATAIAVYITIVSLVYNLVLRQFWHPKEAFKTADELLHVIVPMLYILYWLFLSPKSGLAWNQLPKWLIFPFSYLIYILLRGAATDLYPYFFLDAKKFGYGQVAINCLILLIVFGLFCALFLSIGRKIQSRKKRQNN